MKICGRYICRCGNLITVLWSSEPGGPRRCERCERLMRWENQGGDAQ